MHLTYQQIYSLCQGVIPDEIKTLYECYLPQPMRRKLDNILPMVDPFIPALVNPASLDIVVGLSCQIRCPNQWEVDYRTGRIKKGHDYIKVNLSHFTEEKPFWLDPGDLALVSSMETFHIPKFLDAKFALKSSAARQWYEHLEAGFCDPNWHNSKLTMEIANLDKQPLPLYPGMPIGQLVFTLTFGLPERDYSMTGRYNNDSSEEQSKGLISVYPFV